MTGNRTGETLRVPGQAATVRSYSYPASGQPRPHAVQQASTTAGPGPSLSYGYDQAGNTISRGVGGQAQDLTWDVEGRLVEVGDGTDTSSMVYDADGVRLLRHDGDEVTVFAAYGGGMGHGHGHFGSLRSARREGDMRYWKAILIMMLISAGPVFLGCSFVHPIPDHEPADLIESDVIGTWRESRTGDVIVFRDDGIFEATNLPHQIFANFTNGLPAGFNPERDKLPAHGRWLLGPLGQPKSSPKYMLIIMPEVVAGRPDSGAYELRPEKRGRAFTDYGPLS